MNVINNIFSELKQKNKIDPQEKEERKKNIEIYGKSKLPKKGWIQACYSCDSPTSHTYVYENDIIENKYFSFSVYICKDCKRTKILNETNIKHDLNKHILSNFLSLIIYQWNKKLWALTKLSLFLYAVLISYHLMGIT